MKAKFFSSGLLAPLLFLAAFTSAVADPGEQVQSLDGKWDFTTESDPALRETGKWDSITVPGNWDTLPQYSTFVGHGWYRTTFHVPPDWKGRHLRLCFGAVYSEAHVFLNGTEIGSHNGGYTPFEFDVTDAVLFGAANQLVVDADNTYRRGAWWHWGGISRNVNLVANNDIRLVWQHIDAVPDLAAGTAKISVRFRIANTGASDSRVRLASRILATTIDPATATVPVPARSEAEANLSFDVPRQDVRLWDFDHPNLYKLETTLSEGETVVHGKTDTFGIRLVEVKPDGLWLNGDKVRLTGFNRVSDSNEYGNTEPDVLVHGDVDLMKSAGANMARLMHFPQAPNLLDYLDEKGMLIFEEIPVWGGGDPNVKTNNPLTRQWLREMIERDYNHPCIIGWSPGNEIEGHYAYVGSMFDYIRRELDSTRLLSYASNTAARGNSYGRSNDPATLSDMIMINSYGNFDNVVTRLHEVWPEKPVFFSEWGYHQIGSKPSATIPQLEKGIAETASGHPFVIGFSIWTFNDYRSGFKDTPASGNREWGLVDIERRPKAAYEQVRQAYSPVHALTVADGKIRIEPRSPDEIPSYALRGYHLKWETTSTNGAPSQSGEIPVPDLKPGDPPWETSLPESDPVKVRLISPTGYDVTDAEG